MAVALRETEQCLDFFQQTILRTVRQWQQSEAVQQIDVPVLDKNRLTILNIINRGLEYQPSWPELKELVIAFASYMERRGHWEVWRDVLDASIELAQTLNDADAEITLTALFARLSQRQSRGAEVVRYYRRVIRLAKRHGNPYEEARACSNLGYYYIDAGHWWRAEVLSCHALALFEELGSEHGRAHTHNHLGLLYTRMRQWDDAKLNLTQACRLWKAMGDEQGLLRGLINLGGYYNEVGRPKYAISYLSEALVLVEQTGEQAETGTILNNIGNSYLDLEDYDSARDYLELAKKTHRLFSNSIGLAHVWHNFGLLAMKEYQLDEAKNLFEESLKLHRESKNWKEHDMAMFDLIDCLIKKRELHQATVYLNELELATAAMKENRHRQSVLQQITTYRDLLAEVDSPSK